MTFGEKVRELRIKNGYSQDELAAMTGVTKRTVRNWETEGKYPRNQALYARIASALGCNEEYLRGEQELFITRAAQEYGTRGQQQAQAFLDSTRAMFAGGDLSPEDIDMIGKHFMEMFWEAKENAKKFTPRKYLDNAAPAGADPEDTVPANAAPAGAVPEDTDPANAAPAGTDLADDAPSGNDHGERTV